MAVWIKTSDGWSYRITGMDLLWLGRAAQGESGDPASTIWTWMQRYSLPAFRAQYPTLASLVVAHSQPVNPAWTRTGRFCAPGGTYADRDQCSEERLVRRDRLRALSRAELSERVRSALTQLEAGVLPNPLDRAIDFADETTTNAFLERNPDHLFLRCIEGNCFVASPTSMRWPDHHVRLETGTHPAWWWTLGLVALLGAGGYVAWRKDKRERIYRSFNRLPKTLKEW